MKVLVTGGLGYIGSHTIVKLLESDYEVICVDDLSNSNIAVKEQIKKITGKDFEFYKLDLKNEESIKIIHDHYKQIDVIIHFAAKIYVPESIQYPLKYYHHNILSLLNISKIALDYKCNLIFSSSSTVYGVPNKFPLDENMPLTKSLSPYGNSKRICEELLIDLELRSPISITSLRYFNPVGAHDSCLIGEKPLGEPVHLLPYITQVAIGLRKELKVYGNDYDTPDGTCIRDYIHVEDVAEAHIKCIPFMNKNKKGYHTFNIGYGRGISVLELIKQFEKTTGLQINYRFVDRREGDVSELWSNIDKAKKYLSWNAKHDIENIIKTAWQWERNQKI